MPWLTGTGYGTLPEDSPQEGADSGLLFRPDGMIRVYFHIQWDYLRKHHFNDQRPQSAAHDTEGNQSAYQESLTLIPKEQKECIDEERNLLEAFFTALTEAINEIAVEVGSPDEAPIHLYFYTRQERDHLMDAVRRHSSLITALRSPGPSGSQAGN